LKKDEDKIIKYAKASYDFDSVMEYYEARNEFKYIGIIDKESSRRKHPEELKDVFKIRNKRSKILDKKRGTGISSFKGAVCNTSKSKGYLKKVANYIGVKIGSIDSKISLCEKIKEKLLFLEKYSTEKKKNKMTYMIIPYNHPIYPFPYNLEDRTVYIKDKIRDKIKFDIKLTTKIIKQKINKIAVNNYQIEIKDTRGLKDFGGFLKSLGAKKKKDMWIIEIK